MRFLYHPDTILTVSALETFAEGLLSQLPIPGIEGSGFDAGVIWRTVLDAAVDQESIKTVTDSRLETYSDDYTLTQLHTVPTGTLEDIVNDLLADQAAMILGPAPRIVCSDFLDVHYPGTPSRDPGELNHTTPRCVRALSEQTTHRRGHGRPW